MKHSQLVLADILHPLPESVTLCATVDDSGNEHVITDMMIRRACEQMDSQQAWPCASDFFAGSLRTLSKNTAKIIPFPRRGLCAG